MRITELFTAQSIALDEAQQDRSQIIDRLVELQATHGNIKDKEAYKKGLYAREDEGSTCGTCWERCRRPPTRTMPRHSTGWTSATRKRPDRL